MRKPWSITTTTRNPFRLRSQLELLKRGCSGGIWDDQAQVRFQVLLIQSRLYGYGSTQFLNNLSDHHRQIIANAEYTLNYEEALDIFNSKNYKDPAMRGRQSFNPLKKLGFVRLDLNGILRITKLGEQFLSENYDLSDIFLRSFLKWQIPNPDSKDYKQVDGYNIKPFVGILHLTKSINEQWVAMGGKSKGLSKEEFCLFAPALINYNDVNNYAQQVVELRQKQNLTSSRQAKAEIFASFSKEFAANFLNTDSEKEINKLLNNLKDYGDNAIRYFRFTNLLYIRGGGFYVDLEPRRRTEIKLLLENDNASALEFTELKDYQKFLSDINQPVLPWETQTELTGITKDLVEDINDLEKELKIQPQHKVGTRDTLVDAMVENLKRLRSYRRELQEKIEYQNAQSVEYLDKCINILSSIHGREDRPILLEKFATAGLRALNDAEHIKPNYPVGDDSEPTFTAPGNMPDIECFYNTANSVCEVTMLTSRDQFYHEGQPVMRHLRDFEEANQAKPAYCLFIAPSIHRDTLNTYWNAVKYEYEGKKQKIIPLTIEEYVHVLKTLRRIKQSGGSFCHTDLFRLYDNIIDVAGNMNSSPEWREAIPDTIRLWAKGLNSQW